MTRRNRSEAQWLFASFVSVLRWMVPPALCACGYFDSHFLTESAPTGRGLFEHAFYTATRDKFLPHHG